MHNKQLFSWGIILMVFVLSGCGKVAKEASSSDSGTSDKTGYTLTETYYFNGTNELDNYIKHTYDSTGKIIKDTYI